MKFNTPLLLLAVGSAFSGLSHAHGTLDFPVSRIYQCYLEGPESPTSDACKAAKALAGPSPMYNWSSISQNAGGNDKAFVPDGELCSGGNNQYRGMDLARSDWKRTDINTSGAVRFSFYGSAPHATKRWDFYITKDSYDMDQPLRWNDLQKFCEHGNVALDGNKRYNMDCQLPDGYNGDRIIYNVWERSDSAETFYTCSDVRISGLAGGSNAGSNGGGNDGSNAGNNDQSNTDSEEVVAPQLAAIQSPIAGSTLSATTTFSVNHADSTTTWIYLGSAKGLNDYARVQVNGNQVNIADIPQNNQPVFLTLWSNIEGQWQTQSYQYRAGQAASDNNNSTDSTIVNLGKLQANTDLTEGSIVTLRLMDNSASGNAMSDLETHSLVIGANMGNKHLWVWHLAKLVNKDSQYIRIGLMAQDDGGIDTVIPVAEASGNTIYSMAGDDLHIEIETAQANNSNDSDTLILTASATVVENSALITVSGAQSSGIDIQNASYQWTVTQGQAEIINANALETAVRFDKAHANQEVTLTLTVISNDQTAQQSLNISHTKTTGNSNTASNTVIAAIKEQAAGSPSIIMFMLLSIAGLLRAGRRH